MLVHMIFRYVISVGRYVAYIVSYMCAVFGFAFIALSQVILELDFRNFLRLRVANI